MPAITASIRLPPNDALEDIVPMRVFGQPDLGVSTIWTNHV
jgi:hypothetical protein